MLSLCTAIALCGVTACHFQPLLLLRMFLGYVEGVLLLLHLGCRWGYLEEPSCT
jgi:hypothetical protein